MPIALAAPLRVAASLLPAADDAARAAAEAAAARTELLNHQRVVALALALGMLVVVFELVRRRKLREEYAFLWIATAAALAVLAWQQWLLDLFSEAIGAAQSTSALFFGGLLFLMLVSLQFSIRLSKLTYRNRMLSQRVALLERELTDLRDRVDRQAGTTAPSSNAVPASNPLPASDPPAEPAPPTAS